MKLSVALSETGDEFSQPQYLQQSDVRNRRTGGGRKFRKKLGRIYKERFFSRWA
jgi:hypothetical protein